MKYEIVIGLEIHAQLLTESKIFCSCSTKFGNEPNSNICPVCTGQPGVLPVLNKKVIEFAIKTAIAVNCKIAPYSIFARKHYFYPDLPKDFQVSQYELPLATNGQVEIKVNGKTKSIRIHRIHLEEDAGKLVHAGSDRIQGATHSLVDFNRTGVPLMEIVSEPDISSPEEARAYVQEIAAILKSLGVCNAKMEEGSLRCDANLSIRPVGQKELGTKTEIKNMNSTKALKDALTIEVERQAAVLESGERITQETRHYNEKTGKTISLRSKEEAHDYRYFPEPDLVPVEVSRDWIEEIKKTIGELPAERTKKYEEEYKISNELSSYLSANFPGTVEKLYELDPLNIIDNVNLLSGPIAAEMSAAGTTLQQSSFTPEKLAKLTKLVKAEKISMSAAKSIAPALLTSKKDPGEIIKEKGLAQVSDETELIKIIQEVIKNNEKSVTDYKSGKKNAIGFLVGQVMKASNGRANPGLVNKLLQKELS